VQTLESRIKSLESQNRDAVALHEAKSAAHDRLAEDLSAQHQKVVALRKRINELEEANQNLENAASSVKFREQSLQQEIDTLKKNNEWYEGELNTRQADNTKFRKEKNAQLSELQRQIADANHTIEGLRRTESSQRLRLDELDQKMEQSLVRIQQLQDEATQNQESFRAELDGQRRLASLHQDAANTAKTRLQEVQAQLNQTNDNAALEVGQLQAEIDSERNQREEAEGRIEELESQVETLQSQVSGLRASTPVPATPRRGLNNLLETPGRAGSPSFMSPGGSRNRAGLSTTELYNDNIKLKKEVQTLQSRVNEHANTMNEMLQELETREPEIEELRQENERLTNETNGISALLEEAVVDREAARKETRKFQGDYQGLLRETEIQRQQLRDLSTQISLLLLQQQVHERGEASLSNEEQTYLRQAASGQLPEESVDDATATNRQISQRLVLFRNITEVQQQNQELLRTIRMVAEQYEGSEAQARETEIDKERQELAQLREQTAQYEDELKSMSLRSQSLTKERDMYRRIVTSRGQAPGDSDAIEHSVNGGLNGTPSHSVQQQSQSQDIAGYEKFIKDLQAHMDALREESATTTTSLRQQVDKLAKDNSQLQSDNMRYNSAKQLAQDRYDLLQNKLRLLQSENNELQKRCDALQDAAAKHDVRTQQTAEDLVEAKSLADSLERENTNLKASRDLQKSIETRLQEDNKSLMEEKSRLNRAVSDLQHLKNEQDLAESENRRRLQTRVESLELELQAAKRKLEDEIEDHKKTTLRREHEQLEARRKTDDLAQALNNMRPELARVQTERDQLQARVDELKTELRLAEERGQALQPRPTARANGVADSTDNTLTREEELTLEVERLQQQLDQAKADVDAANAHMEKYRDIAQDAEDRLEGLQETYGQYEQDMERKIAEKDAKIVDLEQRVDEISDELVKTNTELSTMRKNHEEDNVRFTQQKEQLESENTRLTDEADRYKEAASFHQEDLKAQAEIATRAQQNYENELVKHSEAMKNLQSERQQHNELKTQVAQYKAQAESARVSLTQNEETWAETREKYERELKEERERFKDLKEQNQILHQQYESLSGQISSFKQSRMSVAGGDTDTVNADAGIDGLQEVIRYLRQEKQIVDVQYELSVQENKRLKQQLDHTQEKLDQTTEKLIAEQQSQNQGSHSSAEFLQNTMEQLNLNREAASTLRNEARKAQALLTEKKKELDAAYDRIQPLEARMQELEGELAIKNGELELLQSDRDHWQKRHQDVLQRYDRIDPAELEALKVERDTLKTERDEAQVKVEAFEDRLETEKAAVRAEMKGDWDTRRANMVQQFKDKVLGYKNAKETAQKERDVAHQERDTAQQQLASTQQELASAREEMNSLQQELDTTRAARDEAIANVNAQRDTVMDEEGQVDENKPGFSEEEKRALEERITAAERKAIEESNRAVAMHIDVQSKQARILELENQVVSHSFHMLDDHSLTHSQGELQQRIGEQNSELSRAQQANSQQTLPDVSAELAQAQERASQAESRVQELETQVTSVAPTTTGATSEDVEKLKEELAAARVEADRLREELATAQTENEDLRTRNDIADSTAVGSTQDTSNISEQINQQVGDLKAALAAEHEERMKAAQQAEQKAHEAEQKATQRTDQMKNKLNEALKKARESNADAINSLKTEHQTAIERLNAEYESELARVRQEAQVASTSKPSSGAATEASQKAATSLPETTVKTEKAEDYPTSEWTEMQMREWIGRNPISRRVLAGNINKKVEIARAQTVAEQEQIMAERLKKEVEEATDKTRKELEARNKAKDSVHQNQKAKLTAQIGVVKEAAMKTPERPVGEVWKEAEVAKPSVSQAQPTSAARSGQANANQVSSPKPPSSISSQPAQPAQTAQPQPAQAPQLNGTPAESLAQSTFGQPSFGQPGQSNSFGRPSNQPFHNQGNQPFQPFGQGMGQSRMGMPNQGGQSFGGFSGLPQPGFTGPNTMQQYNANNSRPNSPFNQQQNQQPQGGRGPGSGNAGTGPAALRDLANQNQNQPPQLQQLQQQQSSIPRGGGIPRPGGRGQLNQQNAQGQASNVQGAGNSQIGRGGGRGGRGGRGGGQQHPNAQGGPVPNLNPGASNFQPGAGRGQKRPHPEGGEGDQGQKRTRGGGNAGT
jgi:nucleoprotein TPR